MTLDPKEPLPPAGSLDEIWAKDDDSADKKERLRKLEEHEKLLDRLDPDREVAWQKYAKLRTRLINLFRWRDRLRLVEDADATLDRVAELISAGREIEDIVGFIPGVARKIILEFFRIEPGTVSIEEIPGGEDQLDVSDIPIDINGKIEEEKQLTCLDSCLDKLGKEDRTLILLFYSAEPSGTKRRTEAEKKGTNKEFRKDLAQFLGSTIEALRTRACRIRARVEECAMKCKDLAANTTIRTLSG